MAIKIEVFSLQRASTGIFLFAWLPIKKGGVDKQNTSNGQKSKEKSKIRVTKIRIQFFFLPYYWLDKFTRKYS